MKRPKRTLNDESSLYDYAVAALGRRMRSVAELKRLLRNRKTDKLTRLSQKHEASKTHPQ